MSSGSWDAGSLQFFVNSTGLEDQKHRQALTQMIIMTKAARNGSVVRSEEYHKLLLNTMPSEQRLTQQQPECQPSIVKIHYLCHSRSR